MNIIKEKKIIKSIIHFLSYICYILIGLYVLVLIPQIFGYHPLVVLSGSMSPNLKVGSIVYYHKVEENDLKIGDIITYKLDDKFVSHRIVQIENNEYTTKGDANKVSDSKKIKYSDIIGKCSNFCIIYIGYYINFINNNLQFSIIFVIILMIEFILENKEEKKNGKKRL